MWILANLYFSSAELPSSFLFYHGRRKGAAMGFNLGVTETVNNVKLSTWTSKWQERRTRPRQRLTWQQRRDANRRESPSGVLESPVTSDSGKQQWPRSPGDDTANCIGSPAAPWRFVVTSHRRSLLIQRLFMCISKMNSFKHKGVRASS